MAIQSDFMDLYVCLQSILYEYLQEPQTLKVEFELITAVPLNLLPESVKIDDTFAPLTEVLRRSQLLNPVFRQTDIGI